MALLFPNAATTDEVTVRLGPDYLPRLVGRTDAAAGSVSIATGGDEGVCSLPATG
jgi:hypothetical protein